MTEARTCGPRADRIQDEEERSISTATRATLWFVVIVLLLVWTGVADASPSFGASVTAVAARTG